VSLELRGALVCPAASAEPWFALLPVPQGKPVMTRMAGVVLPGVKRRVKRGGPHRSPGGEGWLGRASAATSPWPSGVIRQSEAPRQFRISDHRMRASESLLEA
jgi:hypothetical protein